jgi:2-methylfumaryl-CoA hydratase
MQEGPMTSKTNRGRFFEDFRLGEIIRHATPRTITEGDVALYTALYGSRFVIQSSDAFARAVGYRRAPVDDLLVFHVVFGKTVPDISLNAVANLGYAAGRFLAPVVPGDTLSTVSEVIGLKENSNRQTGVVYVRSTGYNQDGVEVLDYVRWVMVRKADPEAVVAEERVPTLPRVVSPDALGDACPIIDRDAWDDSLSGSPFRWDDYEVGETIDHVDAMTVEEAEHQLATRLYQNTARVHFDQLSQSRSRHGRRLIYGGHVISLARALSFNGLGNAFHIAAINGGGMSLRCLPAIPSSSWSEILDKSRSCPAATTWAPCASAQWRPRTGPAPIIPLKTGDEYDPSVILDIDLWLLLPR